VTSNK